MKIYEKNNCLLWTEQHFADFAVFSVRSVPRLYNEDQLPLESRVLRRQLEEWEGWRAMAANLPERQHGATADRRLSACCSELQTVSWQ
jgi:hypothetical protein